ncbi:B3 domain-containing transcription factor VRN1-like, partial [Trifolium medium]|nr:B3 domain-containing transcription factor VRN1-like [Trifolium medium]
YEKGNSEGPNAMKHYTFEIVVNSLYPYVSKEVLRRHGEECHGKFAELKVGGKSWSVRLYRQQKGIRFYKGWSKFKEECIVGIGDTCFFELIDEKKLVFKVSFERKK